nr:hypothetical protein BaRGS_016786 [Batillaria attramentaria]
MVRSHVKTPLPKFQKQFGNTSISMADLGMGPLQLKAAFTLLSMDTELTQLDVSGNRFGRHEVENLGELLRSNKFLTHLVLANNSLNGEGLEALAEAVPGARRLRSLDLSGNGLCDRDVVSICRVIEETDCISELILHHNELGQCGVALGNAIAINDTITSLNLSWNHIRGVGAVGLAKGVGRNSRLTSVNFAWNGFGYEGCAALAQALRQNSTLQVLDLTNNRIHPPALLQLLPGITGNKSISMLLLGLNPIPAHLTSYLLDRIWKWKHGNLRELDLQGIVVDKDFEGVLQKIQEERLFFVRYDTSLPLQKRRKSSVDPKNVYNIDPLRILFFIKEHLRTIDLFLKIDQNNDGLLTRDEMKYAFELEGYPISDKALDQVMGYLDTNKNGDVDLGEFFQAERRMKREQIKGKMEEDERKQRGQATQTPLTPSSLNQTVSPSYSQTNISNNNDDYYYYYHYFYCYYRYHYYTFHKDNTIT